MIKGIQLIVVLFVSTQLFAQKGDELILTIEQGEYWWGGLSSKGYETPYDASTVIAYDLWGDNKGNQAQPLLLSNKGR